MKTLLSLVALIMLGTTLHAKLHTELVEYRVGEKVMEGYLAYDDATSAKRPGVLVVHEWMGLNDYTRMRCDQLARLGYVAFAPDMYGKGVRATSPQEAGALAGGLKGDRPLMRVRAIAGLAILQGNRMVERRKIAAIGYCFGGTVALELARSGAEVAGTVSIHGGLDTPNPADAKKILGRVYVQHGADDPNVPPAQVAAFQQEMRDAKVDWYMTYYGNAVHAFTNPAAGNDPSKGAAYNAVADRRSWEDMMTFFEEIFELKPSGPTATPRRGR
jgi:dienelactone hydrolase